MGTPSLSSVSVSSEARLLRAALDGSPVAFSYFDLSDRLRFWNKAYEDLNYRIRPLIREGMAFADLLSELVVMGQIELDNDNAEAWIARRLEHRRLGGVDFRHLNDGRSFLSQERHDELGGTIGFWVDVTHLFADGHLSRDPKPQLPVPPNMAEPGVQNTLREDLQTVLGALELLRESDLEPGSLLLIDQALQATEAIRSVLDRERTVSERQKGLLNTSPDPYVKAPNAALDLVGLPEPG